MIKKKIFSFLFFTVVSLVFSQKNIIFSGKITSDKGILNEVLLELKINKIQKFAVSSIDGDYKFIDINCQINDTLVLKIDYLGYKPFTKSIIVDQENLVFDVNLEVSEASIETIKEVVIETKSKSQNSASKSVYKIDQKQFIKNAKIGSVLNSIPNVFYTENKGVIIEGNLKGKILIDGIEAVSNEFKLIKASEIAKVEIISNPSAIYGTDFFGAIVNIITKKTSKQFFKGALELNGGVRNNLWGIAPNIAYKKGIFNFKSNFRYLQENQIVTDNIDRIDFNGNYNQNYTSKAIVSQNYISSTFGLIFSEKSDFIITGYYSENSVNEKAKGTFSVNNANAEEFNNLSKNSTKDLEISSVYKYKFKDDKTFYFKKKYAILSDIYSSEYTNQTSSFFDKKSKISELTLNLSYDVQQYKILKKSTNIVYDLKYINRNYNFSNVAFYLKQDIFDVTTDIGSEWSEKFSTHLGLTFEHLSNRNDVFSKNYNLILPTFSALYHFKNKLDVKLGFSKRVLRPGAEDLNETLIVTSPRSGSQGNSNLDQQFRNYYSLKFSKQFEKDNIALKFYRASINNSIVDVYKNQGGLLVRTFDNASRYNSTGFDFDYTTKLFKKIEVNFNTGLNYNIYETDDSSVVVKKNSGISFNNSLYLSSNLFKDKVSISFSGSYTNPEYTLLSKRITYPYLDLTMNTNLFKDKLAVTLSAQNLLGDNATLTRDTSFTTDFQQTHQSRNNFTNVLLTLTYNFGKKFDEIANDNTIENNDFRKKQ